MEKEIYEKLSKLSSESQQICGLINILEEYTFDISIKSLEIFNNYNLVCLTKEKHNYISHDLNSLI